MELEELAVKPVAQRAGPRIGVAGGVAVVALVGVLAAGLGVLGGRAEPSPRPSGTATEGAVATIAPTSSPFTGTPLATPWIPCRPDTEGLPVLELQSNGVRTPGLVEVAAGAEPTATITPANPLPIPANPLPIKGPRVEVRPDVVNELWIDGGACALAWSIEVLDGRTEGRWILHEARNPTRDPNVAAQNRFDISQELAALRGIGSDVQLMGLFVFRTTVVRAFWRLRILPLDRPIPRLFVPDPPPRSMSVRVVEGCFTVLTLGSRRHEGLDCDDDLSAELGPPALVDPGDALELRFDGWTVYAGDVACGHLSGLDFVVDQLPVPGCELVEPRTAAFRPPSAPGRWVLAISACASQDGSNGTNAICGTWFAEVLVRG